METFLTEVAKSLIAEHPHDLDQVTVVFNNRRSGLFLRRQFAALGDKPFFLPRIVGIDDLIAEMGCLEIVPNEFLLFELFDIHRNLGIEGRKFETFEEFISFGDMMLADFSEVDLYLVDAQQLFSNLHDLKAIGEWDIESGILTPFQQQYLQFYHSLFQYYTQLRNRLLSQRKAYAGMAYRHVAENIEQYGNLSNCKQICFVGFNAFSACERTIIQHYIKQGIGKLYTDGDIYYYDNPQQEAGHFLRQYERYNIPISSPIKDHFGTSHKKITIVSCPENVLQCKYAGNLLAEQIRSNPNHSIEQTALVLADESLLLPTLNSLPPEIKTANITMGYPFVSTSVHSLMLKLFSLHQRRRNDKFYHTDILEILSDQAISTLLGIPDAHAQITQKLSDQHIIYATADEVAEICRSLDVDPSPILRFFLVDASSVDIFLSEAQTMLQAIYREQVFENNLKEKESLACLFQIINHFIDLQNRYHFVENLSVLLKIYTRMAQKCSVAFYGEPLQGLQILGVLETRNLDFKKVILLSANEGVIPSGRTSNTLIPYNLKTAFGIPTFHDKDAVYAYNFYRLLQRADEIHLLYTTETETLGKGSPSRFILQVRRELSQQYPNNISLSEKVLSAQNIKHIESDTLEYDKDLLTKERIDYLSRKGLSPSALNKFRSCPLKYYYENILQINETDQITEELEQNDLGTYIHKVLETIYTPSIGIKLQKEWLQTSLDNLDTLLKEVLDDEFSHGRSHEGKNHFLVSVAKMQLTNFLKNEISLLEQGNEIIILGLEKELSRPILLPINGETQEVCIKGIADRIDSFNGTTRIIDYKSGKVEEKDLRVKEPEPEWQNVPDKWFQVMLYTWLFSYNDSSTAPSQAGIIPLRNLHSNMLCAQWCDCDFMTDQHLAVFEKMIAEIATDLLHPDIPFRPNHNSKLCQFCPFAETCHPLSE